MALNKACKHCGEASNFGALFCENCGEQLYRKKKFEKFTSDDLKRFKTKKTRMGFSFMIIALQSFCAIFPIYYLLIIFFKIEFLGNLLIVILVISCIFSFIYAIKSMFDLFGINIYLNLKDEASRIRHLHAMENFKAGKFKKISKTTLQELHLKFIGFDTEINKLKQSFKKYFRKSNFFLVLLLLAFSTCLPMNFYFKNIILSLTSALSFSLFFLYPIQYYMQALNDHQQDLTALVKTVDLEKQQDFVHYIEAIGLKTMAKNSSICIIILILILIIILLNVAINYDLSISS